MPKEGWGRVFCKCWITCKNYFIFFLPLNLHAGTGFLLHHYFDTRWFVRLDVGCLPKALEQQSLGMVSHPPGAEQMFAFAVSGGLRDRWYDGFLLYLLEFLYSCSMQGTFSAGIFRTHCSAAPVHSPCPLGDPAIYPKWKCTWKLFTWPVAFQSF